LAITVSCVVLTKHTNALRGQKAAFCAFGAGGTQYQLVVRNTSWKLKGYEYLRI
jgi:hypothetical protein